MTIRYYTCELRPAGCVSVRYATFKAESCLVEVTFNLDRFCVSSVMG